MRRARNVALVLLLSACGKPQSPETIAPISTPPRAQTEASSKASAPASDASQGRLVQIARFDCVKAEGVDNANGFPWSRGLSHWSAGGPGGAAWNAGKLHCALEFLTNCTQGAADIEMRIGGALGSSRHTKIERAGAQQVAFELTADQWGKHFDQSSPLTERFSYRTATFSASVIASCNAPERLGPSDGPRLEFADDRHFTAGFASGE